MGQCPRCGQSIEQDFGMVTCPSCGTILFVDFEGNLQASETSPEPAIDSVAESAVEASPSANVDSQPEVDSFSFEAPPVAPSAYDDSFEPAEVVEPLPVDVQEPQEALSHSDSEDVADHAESAQETESDFQPPPATLQEVIEEVTDYGNSELDEGHALQYELVIEGIDTKEVREAVFEILADVRLGLSVRDLRASIKGGRLELGALNPVRSSVVVSRIRELPVKLRWKQGVLKSE